jgi:hypothetical protein
MKNLRSLCGLAVIFLFTVSAAEASMFNLAGTEWGFPEEIGATARFIQYSQDGSTLTIGTLATTRRACLPEVMRREEQFLEVLSKVRRVEANHFKLFLKAPDGNVLAELMRRDRH